MKKKYSLLEKCGNDFVPYSLTYNTYDEFLEMAIAFIRQGIILSGNCYCLVSNNENAILRIKKV